MQWGEWQALWCSIRLLLTSDMSEGGSSASVDPGSWIHNDVDGWMSGADDVNGWRSLIFLDHSWPRRTETAESETLDKKGLLYNTSKYHKIDQTAVIRNYANILFQEGFGKNIFSDSQTVRKQAILKASVSSQIQQSCSL